MSLKSKRPTKIEVAAMREELGELRASFDLRHQADLRAIALWQRKHPKKKRVWPDHADLVVWLMERLGKKWRKQIDMSDVNAFMAADSQRIAAGIAARLARPSPFAQLLVTERPAHDPKRIGAK